MRRIWPSLAVVPFLVSPAFAQQAAWPPADLTAFEAACRGHPAMQAMVSTAPASEPPAIDRLCGCLGGRLAGISQADADILAGDLNGTTTDAQRAAYAGYAALNERARQGLNACLADQGIAAAAPEGAEAAPGAGAPPPDAAVTAPPAPALSAEAEPAPADAVPPPASAAAAASSAISPDVPPAPRRMSQGAVGFLNACVSSKAFADYLRGIRPAGADLQGAICSCMTGDLKDRVSDADLAVIQGDFAPDAAPPRDPGRDYWGLAETARASLRRCMSEAGVPPNF